MIRMLAVIASIWLVTSENAHTQGKKRNTDRWAVAEKAVVRLPPRAFTELPDPLITHLTQIGCSVPQSFLSKDPHNVIKGQFRRPNQTDWAILCHRSGTTSLLVFWEGAPDKSEELGKSEDRSYLQIIDGDGTIAYSQAIGVARKDAISELYAAYGGTTPPEPLDHEGINVVFLEKGSVTFYWYYGDWLRLSGDD